MSSSPNSAKHLTVEGPVAIKGKRTIHGMGGVGKTRAAIEYAWKHADDYRALLFISADTPEAQLRFPSPIAVHHGFNPLQGNGQGDAAVVSSVTCYKHAAHGLAVLKRLRYSVVCKNLDLGRNLIVCQQSLARKLITLTHMLALSPILSEGTLKLPDFAAPWYAVLLGLLAVVIYVLGKTVYWLYYALWFEGRLRIWIPNLRKWWSNYRQKEKRNLAIQALRSALQVSLTTHLLGTATLMLTLLRFALVAAVIWRLWRGTWLVPQELADATITRPLFGILTVSVSIGYFVFAGYRLKTTPKIVGRDKMTTKPSGDEDKSHGYGLRDVFFWPAMLDVVFVCVCGLLVAGHYTEVHLGLFVAIAAGWLFESPWRILWLWLASATTIIAHWMWGWLLPKVLLPGEQLFEPTHQFLGQVLPRILFWLLVAGFVALMRVVRRNEEEQALFFGSLAESLPFEVFVKDNERRFLYANERMLENLSKVAGEPLTISSVQGKDDVDLGVPRERAAIYQDVDERILAGSLRKFHDYEPSYDPSSDKKIETIKVPIIGWRGAPVYVLGLCSDPDEDDDGWFFRNMVAIQHNHCFFVVQSKGGLRWGNAAYLRWINKEKVDDIRGKGHIDLFENPWASEYAVADRIAIETGSIEREEWNQPKDGKRRRVVVIKHRLLDNSKSIIGVRGFFFDVHRAYLRRLSRDIIVSRFLPGWVGHLASIPTATEQFVFETLRYAIRLLNFGDSELTRMGSGDEKALQSTSRADMVIKRDVVADPTALANDVLSFMKSQFPGIEFMCTPWTEAPNVAVDRLLFGCAVLGLAIAGAERIERFKCPKGGKKLVSLTCSLATRHGTQSLLLRLSDSSGYPDLDLSAREMADEIIGDKEDFWMGVQIALRVAERTGDASRLRYTSDESLKEFRLFLPTQ
ncbi:MAG: hypothetical protein K1X78_16620 [Verrucomicrobiaceae bacterium]|nr:hypothetical protein [Verrucomicrobiaceae bacterium]